MTNFEEMWHDHRTVILIIGGGTLAFLVVYMFLSKGKSSSSSSSSGAMPQQIMVPTSTGSSKAPTVYVTVNRRSRRVTSSGPAPTSPISKTVPVNPPTTTVKTPTGTTYTPTYAAQLQAQAQSSLYRSLSASSLAHWNSVAQSQGLGVALNGIKNSPEAIIQSWYHSYLHRKAGATGLSHWGSLIAADHGNIAPVFANFSKSPEFIKKNG